MNPDESQEAANAVFVRTTLFVVCKDPEAFRLWKYENYEREQRVIKVLKASDLKGYRLHPTQVVFFRDWFHSPMAVEIIETLKVIAS